MNFKTTPFSHQLAEYTAHWNTPFRAVLWEQGTGKSKLIVDQAARNYEEGHIDCLFVLAPNGVHANWVTDEIPAHLDDEIAEVTKTFVYWTGKAGNKGFAHQFEAALRHEGFLVFVMAYDAIKTELGKKRAKKLLEKRKCFFVLDEAARIKNPNAARTKTVLAAGKYADRKRILTGTPVANNPFDVYAPFKFLDWDFWYGMGVQNFTAFKAAFGLWALGERKDGRTYPDLRGFRDMPRLRAYLEPHMTRVTKDEVLDLPPKLYTKRPFVLSPQQRKIYNELREEFLVMLDSGDMVAAPLAMVRMLRLQQVSCGYVPVDADQPVHRIDGPNPRLESFMEALEEIDGKVIVWCRFRLDIDLIMERLAAEGISAVRYDGSVQEEQRVVNKDRFQKGDARLFVGNPAVGGEGLTLHAARTVVYYSHSFRYDERKQSEDRAHRIGQEHPVNYIDLMGVDTIDQRIVRNLRMKQDFSDQVLGDKPKEWI